MVNISSLGGKILIDTVEDYIEFTASEIDDCPPLLHRILKIHGISKVTYSKKENQIGLNRVEGVSWDRILPNVLLTLSRTLPRDDDEHKDGYGLVCRAKTCPPTAELMNSLGNIGTVYSIKIIL